VSSEHKSRATRFRPSGADRESIMDASADLFRKRGYDATSVEMIASALGLSKSSLYHHVESKEEILGWILTRAMSEMMGILEERRAHEGSSLDRLVHVISRAVEVQLDRVADVSVMLHVRGNTDVELWALERRRQFDGITIDLIKRAQRDGFVDNRLDAETTARLAFGMIAWTAEWYAPSGRISAPQLRDQVMSILLHGIQASPDGTG
jgi:AcrR family transcriptional regulator